MTGRSGNALLLAALFGLYVLTGKVGLSVAFVHASATAVWPPTGIALAAFLTLGYECWPAIFAGAFVVNISTAGSVADRKSTRLNSSHVRISYAVFCLKKKKKKSR